jgi:hypothetical protein
MPQPNDLSRSLVALDQNSTIIAVVELSQSSWLVAGMLPGIERQPHKKLEPSPERLLFQKESALTLWYRAHTADSRIGTRKTMIVALARKLIIALWRFVTTGEPLEGVVLRPAS